MSEWISSAETVGKSEKQEVESQTEGREIDANEETPEVIMQPVAVEQLHNNPRIAALMQEVRSAEERLITAIADLEKRETDPTFQKATSLFDEGIRGYINRGVDGYERLYLIDVNSWSREHDDTWGWVMSNGLSSVNKEAFHFIGVEPRLNGVEVLRHIIDLTKESSDNDLI